MALATYQAEQPVLDIPTFFAGHVQGHGMIQDYTGTVVSRFVVDIMGTASADGTQVKLVEDFVYASGKTDQRIWHLQQNPDGTWRGEAGDILAPATGKLAGNAMNLRYRMDVPRGNGSIRLSFDDWMFLIDENHLINRTYLRKFGFTVAEITIHMRRMPSAPAQE